jgi:pSer/pThr/pTyr-binding forkhead associated (FHA) protein
MRARVTLTVVEGQSPGREYMFSGRAIGAVGRSPDCLVALPNNLLHQNVSRHHCQLDIDPPQVRVRDLGSRNGTFVNGEPIGQRLQGQDAEHADAAGFPLCPLHEGDELRVGDIVFCVSTSVWGEDVNVPAEAEVHHVTFG